MIIEKGYEIWRIAESGEKLRGKGSALSMVHFIRVGSHDRVTDYFANDGPIKEQYNGVAVATDGFCAAFVPVEFGVSDVEGLVHWSVVKQGIVEGYKGRTSYSDPSFDLGEATVKIRSGAILPRFGTFASIPIESYPNVFHILPLKRPTLFNVQNLLPLTFDFKVLNDVMTAICARRGNLIRHIRMAATHEKNVKPILVEVKPKAVHEVLTAPIGVMMPVHSEEVAKQYATLINKARVKAEMET